MESRRFRFTKAALLAVKVPEGKQFVEVQDGEIRALRCRVNAGGRMTLFVDKTVKGKHVKKTLGQYHPGRGGKTVDDFRVQARAELTAIADDAQAWLEGEPEADAAEITLTDAFNRALGGSNRGAMAARDWNDSRDRFLAWMKKHNPAVTTWARVRRQHVKDYLAAQKPTAKNIERGRTELSANRKRLLLQPVTQTARYMWLEYEIPNVAERLGLSSRLTKPPAPVYMADVLAFLDHLKDAGEAHLEAGAALQGLAGLAVLEVLRLTWSKVDLKEGLIEVSGEVKNPYRNRVIPIPERAVEALKRAHANRPAETVQSIDGGRVVVSPSGAAFEGGNWSNYSMRIRRELRAWNAGIPWAPKDLRNAVMTLAALRGFSGDVLEQYVGHAPKTVTARNYIPRLSAASIGEAAQLEEQVGIFRRLVVNHVEAEIARVQANAKAKGGAKVEAVEVAK